MTAAPYVLHTDRGVFAGPDFAGVMLAEFGRDAFYRSDAFLRPYALGRILRAGGNYTAALVLDPADADREPGVRNFAHLVALARHRAGLDEADTDA